MPNTAVLISVALALTLAACSSAGSASESGRSTSTSVTSSTVTSINPTTTTAETTLVPVSVSSGFTADDHLAWVVGALSRPRALTVAEIEARFSESFFQLVTPEQIIATSLPLAGQWTVVDDDGGDLERSAVIEGAGGLRLNVDLVIDPEDGGRMTDLSLRPVAAPLEGPVTNGSVDAAIAAVGSRSGYGLFDVSSDSCAPIHAKDVEVASAIGSAFKLWILVAIAEEIEGGDMAWDDTVVLADDLRSTPDGDIGQRPTGSEITIAELAAKMTSISDNTATDLLLDHVGRERVEQAMIDSGVADPTRNIPLLSTRELFLLKLDPRHGGYVDLDPGSKRAYLDGVLAGESLLDLDETTMPDGPWNIEELEWFAAPADLCRTYLRLADLAAGADMAPLADALSINPGQAIDEDRWSTVWYKGGSEPGVLALTWYLVDTNGNRYVAAGAINDSTTVFAEAVAAQALGQMIPLLEAATS